MFVSIGYKISLYAAVISGFTFLLAIVIYNHYGNFFPSAFVVTAIAMAAVYAGMNIYAKRSAANVRKLNKSIREIINSGDYTKRVERIDNDELTAIANSINDLLLQMEDHNSELKDVKKDLEEQDSFKTEFVESVTHELRTPMHAILSYSDLSIKKLKQNKIEEAETYIKQINKSGKRLLMLINDALQFSKLETGHENFEMKEGSLHETVSEILKEYEALINEKSLSVKIEDHETVKKAIWFDHHKMEQVISNILSNAIKFSPEKEEIVVAFETAKLEDDVEQSMRTMLVLSIEDHGIGIPEEDTEIIFDKFVRSSKSKDYPGTGLGLSISKEIVEGHGGKIWVESREDKGSCFYIALPLVRDEVYYDRTKAA